MNGKRLIVLAALAVLLGCAGKGRWVSVQEIPATGDIAGAKETAKMPKENIAYVKESNPVTVDAALDDWQGAEWMALDRSEQYIGEGWQGPEDLSGRLAMAYDHDMLYVAAEVKDETAVWSYTAADIWNGDSIQVALDPWQTRSVGAYSAEVVEFGFSGAEDRAEVQVWRWSCGKPLEPGPFKAETALEQAPGGVMRYELAIPLAELGTWRPSLSGSAGGTWLINDNDGSGRKGFLEWTPGIGAVKDPSQFGLLVFEPPPPGAESPAFVARFHWDRTVTAQGRPLEVRIQTSAEGKDRTVTVETSLDSGEGDLTQMATVPAAAGRRAYAVALNTNRIAVGRHTLSIRLSDGEGYEASTSRSIYIYPPPSGRGY